ncbi:MAG: DedA family protein [Bdellovibrionales bacterium]
MVNWDIFELLHQVTDMPWLFFLIIIVATFITEDLATTTSAIIASQTEVHFMLPLSALFTGIILGDIGLYFMGSYGGRLRFLKKYKETDKAQIASKLLDKNLMAAILISRCIPGMRLATYTLIGGLQISFRRYISIVIFAVMLWTGILFSLFYKLGDVMQNQPDHIKWGVMTLIVLAFLGLQYAANILFFKKKRM